MIRPPPRSTRVRSSAASDVYKRQVNNHYVPALEKSGLIISARTPSENLPEIMELPQTMHPWFVGVQFHPEFTSTPRTGHPLFKAFVEAALQRQTIKLKQKEVAA